ncbi:MAG: hypothetical protein Q9157_007849 [Trypethelium eluteriae]
MLATGSQSHSDAAHSSEQVQDLAFNLMGWAAQIPGGMFANHQRQVIRVLARFANRTPFREELQECQSSNEIAIRPSLELTGPEVDGLGSDTTGVEIRRYIVVGFVPQNLPGKCNRQHPLQITPRQDLVGVVGSDAADIRVDSPGNPPLVAVIKEGPLTDGVRLQYHVLLTPRGGLCTPFRASKYEIFYLPRFRDGPIDYKRNRRWDLKEKDLALATEDRVNEIDTERNKSHSGGNQLLGSGPTYENFEEFKRALENEPLGGNSTYEDFDEFKHSLENEPFGYGSTYEDSQFSMEYAKEGPETPTSPEVEAIRTFMIRFDDAVWNEVQQMQLVIGRQWPELRDITTETILTLKQGLLENPTLYLFQHDVHNFLGEGHRHINSTSSSLERRKSPQQLVFELIMYGTPLTSSQMNSVDVGHGEASFSGLF